MPGIDAAIPAPQDILLRTGQKVNHEGLRGEKVYGGGCFGKFRRRIVDLAGESEGLDFRPRADPFVFFRLNC